MSAIHPQPKPQRSRGRGIDTSGLPFGKHPPVYDARYRDFVRGQVCCVFNTECGGVTEHAHLITAGRGIKASDHYAVPLCTLHHAAQHRLGILTFAMNEGVDLWRVCAELLASYVIRLSG